ncbi:MAG: peptide deformylase [Bacteroidales bacterium]
MILPIYIYGSAVLRAQAKEIDIKNIDKEEFKKYLDNMWETMYDSDGVGLAAPQAGISERLFVIDGSDMKSVYPYLNGFKRVMINPEILEESKETVSFGEGCLSVPNIYGDVIRPAKIKIKYFDENLEEEIEELDGYKARMVQHEFDHLNGVLFVDRFPQIRKKMIRSKLHNISNGKFKVSYKFKQTKKK